MSEFIGIPRIDRLLEGADETVNRHGNRVRQLLLLGDRSSSTSTSTRESGTSSTPRTTRPTSGYGSTRASSGS